MNYSTLTGLPPLALESMLNLLLAQQHCNKHISDNIGVPTAPCIVLALFFNGKQE